jgi:hypothetical protein
MEPTQELADYIYRERVRRARRTSPAEKFLDGPRLFDSACGRMKDGIRAQFPDADATKVEEILVQRLDRVRRLEGSSTL